ncbi:serine/threonine-protein kinase [Actinacidiphila epipremni]|uniref:Serine/threonine protein kinase n=1 Tax=Actinacidiphila epipremni TaxID=2053013 RepID=A0ABX1A1R0_9ACTN|nr:serine/threonine-protein kinase [Actinacidiphila epipremni]NJP47716.1 serine/threonine protein kinase [Actinacidiphila epipremni]
MSGAGGASGSGEVFQPLEADDPASVGAYRLAARLGAGGMGKVYLSYTPAGRPVAVKVIRPEFAEDAEFRRRFKQEVQAAQRVQGLYTAPVIDSDADGPRPWLATAFVPGPTLSSAVVAHGPLPVQTVLLLVAGIAEALEAVHGAGLVHRDLKPSNVLLASDGPRVIDFGIARAADATALTGSGVTIGTPAFMSPEQAAGREITPATDVFALGQVAAYAALGAPAYGDGPSHAVLYRIVHEEPDLATLPEDLRPLVRRCLAKVPAERPSLAEVVGMCRTASQQTELRRPDQWLPRALAAEIPARHSAPDSPAAPPVPAAPPAVAGGGAVAGAGAGAVAGAAAALAAKDVPPPAPAAPPTPPRPAAAPAAEGPHTPPPPATRPDVTPPPAAPAAAQQHAQPHPATHPATHPAQPPAAEQPPAAYAYPATQPGAPAAPGGPGAPAGPAYGYPQPGGPSPYAPQGTFGAVQQPAPAEPARKGRRKVLVLSLVAALVVIGGAVGGAIALSGGKGDDGKNDDAAPPSHSASAAPTTDTPATTEPADDDPSDDTATEEPTSQADPNPQPEPHTGIQLPDGYHLDFSDTDIQPQNDTGDDLTYSCSFSDCSLSASSTKLVLLDHDEAGSLDTCLHDTRYTQDIAQGRMTAGSQICARTPEGTVALITYKQASKANEASTYVVLDITLWRNALPDSSNDDD